MSIVADKVKIEGNSIFIRSNPTTGILALTSFVDDAAGVDGSHTFTKSFRYSTNGIIFSDWHPLTTGDITAIQVEQKDTLVIELQYFKNQPLGDTQLTVTTATIGTTDDPIQPGYFFKNSVFSQFFGSEDVNVLNWYINVLDKLYQRGIIPAYIDRLNSLGQPDDFIEFWKGICKFFAYYVIYARQFQNFYTNQSLLQEYLEERGMKTSSQNTLDDLQLLMQEFYYQVFNRGTIHIVDRVENGAAIDGELLRLIYYATNDEFIFNPSLPQHFGWNMKNSSPLYRGMTIHDNANKFYEPGVEPKDISKYPITGNVTIVNDSSINKDVIFINSGGGINGNSNLIKVSEFLDYELFFFIRKDDGNNLTIGFDAYDSNYSPLQLLSRTTGTSLSNYFTNKNLPRADKYVAVRLFLYNKLKPVSSNDNLNLKMVDGVSFVAPRILVNGVNAHIYNIRFVPMLTPYSKGFVQENNFIDCWIKNNNNQFTFDGINAYIRKYLIPLDSHLQLIQEDRAGDYSTDNG